jgi:hypothetical protein
MIRTLALELSVLLSGMSDTTEHIAALESRIAELERQQKLAGVAIAILTYATPFRKRMREMMKAIVGGMISRSCQH